MELHDVTIASEPLGARRGKEAMKWAAVEVRRQIAFRKDAARPRYDGRKLMHITDAVFLTYKKVITIKKHTEHLFDSEFSVGGGRSISDIKARSENVAIKLGLTNIDPRYDDHLFSGPQGMTPISKLLLKDPATRTDEDVQQIYDAVKHFQFFTSRSTAMGFFVCRCLHYCRFAQGHAVCHEGQIGRTAYIIFSGSLIVLINSTKNLWHSKMVATLTPGICFGELALLGGKGNDRRKATVIADKPVELLMLERTDYLTTLKAVDSVVLQEYMVELPEVNIFRNWPHMHLQKIAFAVAKSRYVADSYILKQGEISDRVFFVISGAVRAIHQTERPVRTTANEIIEGDALRKATKKIVKKNEGVINISYATQGDFFGFESILSTPRNTSIIAASPHVIVYSIPSRTFVEIVQTYSRDKVKELIEEMQLRDAARRERIEYEVQKLQKKWFRQDMQFGYNARSATPLPCIEVIQNTPPPTPPTPRESLRVNPLDKTPYTYKNVPTEPSTRRHRAPRTHREAKSTNVSRSKVGKVFTAQLNVGRHELEQAERLLARAEALRKVKGKQRHTPIDEASLPKHFVLPGISPRSQVTFKSTNLELDKVRLPTTSLEHHVQSARLHTHGPRLAPYPTPYSARSHTPLIRHVPGLSPRQLDHDLNHDTDGDGTGKVVLEPTH
jgi:CRP-like cAMP-binding protein